jgi:hypothetical protein
MNESVCNCGKPTRDAAYVCEECLTRLFKALGDVPWLVEQLDIQSSKQRGVDYSAMGSAAQDDHPLPMHLPATEARSALRQTMFTWIKFCTEEHITQRGGVEGWPADTLIAMSRWLMCRVDGLAFNDLGHDAADEIGNAIATCRRVVDRAPERRYAGPCECGRDLYHKPGAVEVKCRDCDRSYDVGELYEWMKSQVLGRLVTAQEGATLLGRFALETPKRIIYGWEDRKLIMAHGSNPAGKRIYLFDDLLALAAKRSA